MPGIWRSPNWADLKWIEQKASSLVGTNRKDCVNVSRLRTWNGTYMPESQHSSAIHKYALNPMAKSSSPPNVQTNNLLLFKWQRSGQANLIPDKLTNFTGVKARKKYNSLCSYLCSKRRMNSPGYSKSFICDWHLSHSKFTSPLWLFLVQVIPTVFMHHEVWHWGGWFLN